MVTLFLNFIRQFSCHLHFGTVDRITIYSHWNKLLSKQNPHADVLVSTLSVDCGHVHVNLCKLDELEWTLSTLQNNTVSELSENYLRYYSWVQNKWNYHIYNAPITILSVQLPFWFLYFLFYFDLLGSNFIITLIFTKQNSSLSKTLIDF